MNDLINVGELCTHDKMTSLQISELTGKEHKHVIRDIDNLLNQGVDKTNFGLTYYIDKSNRSQRMYELTKKGSLILASGYNAVLREKIINRWEYLENEKNQIKPFELPKDYLSALKALVISEEAKQALQLENESMKPKVEFYDDIIDSKDAIDMASVAKTINMGIGRNKLFELLRDKKVLMANNSPYQKYVDSGWFRCVESKYSKSNGDICINLKTVVLQKGIDGIRKLIRYK